MLAYTPISGRLTYPPPRGVGGSKIQSFLPIPAKARVWGLENRSYWSKTLDLEPLAIATKAASRALQLRPSERIPFASVRCVT
jgi:hypothetical protein